MKVTWRLCIRFESIFRQNLQLSWTLFKLLLTNNTEMLSFFWMNILNMIVQTYCCWKFLLTNWTFFFLTCSMMMDRFMIFFGLLGVELCWTIITTIRRLHMLIFDVLFPEVWLAEFAITMWTNRFQKLSLLFNITMKVTWRLCIHFESIFSAKLTVIMKI